MRHILSRRGALGLALAGAASPALAQQPGFPTRAVTIIVRSCCKTVAVLVARLA